mgnify:CR=1 FL=1
MSYAPLDSPMVRVTEAHYLALCADNECLRSLLIDVRERMRDAEITASVLTGQLPMLRRLATIMGDSVERIGAVIEKAEGKA